MSETRSRARLGSAAGFVLGAVAILVALYLEGGQIAQVLQPTAALIVLGGTAGAVLVQFSPGALRHAARYALEAMGPAVETRTRREQIVQFAVKARRSGMLSIDGELKGVDDPFFRRTLMMAVDGVSVAEMRDILGPELDRLEEEDERAAQVWEAAGGFAPTIGILGAVLGLIQVMQKLDNIGAVGRGIAVAFVATLYGVGSANLLFLPLAGKLRMRARDMGALREMTLEGVIAMVEGANPRLLRERLGVAIPLPAAGEAPNNVRRMAGR